MSDNIFAKGIYFKTPPDNCPAYVKRKVSVNVDEFIEFLQEYRNDKGYVNFDQKEATSGHWYLQLDTWQPENSEYNQNLSTPNNKPFSAPPFGKFGEKKEEGLFESEGGGGGAPLDFDDDIPFSCNYC